MRRQCIWVTVTGLVLALATVAPVSAQDTPRVELSGGYQLAALRSDIDETMEMGWYADIAANMNEVLSAVFQVGGNYKTIEETATFDDATATVSADLKVHQFMGGVRVNARTRSIVPFAEFLVGGVNGSASVSASGWDGDSFMALGFEDSGTDLAIQAGGGATFRLTDHLGARAGAAWVRVYGGDEEGDLDIIRFTAGIVVGF